MWLRAFKFLGYNIVDASLYGNTETTGVIKFLEEIKHGSDGIIAVDGPKGPMCKAKKGAIYLAKKTGAVIVPVAAEAAKKTVRTNQWDKLFIPKLFSKGVLVFGSPIRVPQDADDNAISRFTLRLQENLNSLTCQAQALARA
jgi:lysophospholipid acyltransferase (LPLAT)-like uncharacterized protein